MGRAAEPGSGSDDRPTYADAIEEMANRSLASAELPDASVLAAGWGGSVLPPAGLSPAGRWAQTCGPPAT